jgi:poly(hydroxyalkanoate) depolymerase family esterase
MAPTFERRSRRRALSFLLAFGAVFAASPALAASMQKVEQSVWQSGVTGLPSYVNMYIYVPDAPAAKPPIVVVPHHCQGSASSTNTEISTLYQVANKTGFIVIIPEATGQNCWDAGSSRSLKHGGNGDTAAIVQMVKYTLAKYKGDEGRVYTVGGSSGGIMTEALLGVYPDVFMAGVSLMGVPCGCWAQDYHDVTGKPSDGTGQWSGPCAGGTVSKTAQQWGDLVRSYFPGYTGHRPRLQHWHGTSDTTLNYKVMAEDIKEWTNVLGLSTAPTTTDTPKSGTTHQAWKNACGYTVYETFALSGVGHAVPFDGAAVAAYFGIDTAGGPDPETAACSAGGGAGSGGHAGASGSAGAGGSPTGGSGGAGGASDAGTSPVDGMSPSDSGAATDARSGSGGTSAPDGGSDGSGGQSGETDAGAMGTGGAPPGSGGQTATGGASATGGTSMASGGSSGSGGAATGGGSGSGGSSASDASSSSGRDGTGATASGNSASGCAYVGVKPDAPGELIASLLVLAALGLTERRSRRGRVHR